MIHEYLLKSIMSVFNGPDTPRAAASRYSVLNREILGIEIKMESVK